MESQPSSRSEKSIEPVRSSRRIANIRKSNSNGSKAADIKQTSSNNESTPERMLNKVSSALRRTKPRISTEDAEDLISHPLSNEERADWKGWIEIESEPAFFNVMLRDLGVQDVKVEDVTCFDDEFIGMLARPIYGLIFLFQFVEDDPDKQETECPEHIWFANQTVEDACATFSLLNVVMNIPDLEIGPHLSSLKEFGHDMHPVLRGDAIGNHDFIRDIHNSFARRMDMLDSDLTAASKYRARNNRKKKMSNSSKKNSAHSKNDNGFHFNAFLPIDGVIWKLDGLESQPMKLGEYSGDWMEVVVPHVEARMLPLEEEQYNFSILAVCQDPMPQLLRSLSSCARTLALIETVLREGWQDKEWDEFDKEDSGRRIAVDMDMIAHFGLKKEQVQVAILDPDVEQRLRQHPDKATLQVMLSDWKDKKEKTMGKCFDEQMERDNDNEKAAGRRHDFTPMIDAWISALAANRMLEDLVKDLNGEQAVND